MKLIKNRAPHQNLVGGEGEEEDEVLFANEERKIVWTQHSKMKLKQYRFSEKRVLRIFRKPDRTEEGIAEGTIAVMQITGTKKHPTEAWTMYVVFKKPGGITIVSAWRYPGRTPAGERPIIPEDTLEELNDLLKE